MIHLQFVAVCLRFNKKEDEQEHPEYKSNRKLYNRTFEIRSENMNKTEI